MRNSVVIAQFYNLRVNQNQLHFIRICLIKKAENDTVDADRLTGTGRTCNQQMRHALQVCDNIISADILTYRKGNLGLGVFKFLRFNDITKLYHGNGFVFYFNTYCSLTRNRCFNSNASCFQVQCNIIRQAHDAAYFNAHSRLYFISGNRRSLCYLNHTCIYMEVFQRFFQFHGFRLQCTAVGSGCCCGSCQKIDWRHFVDFHRFCRCFQLFCCQHGLSGFLICHNLLKFCSRCSAGRRFFLRFGCHGFRCIRIHLFTGTVHEGIASAYRIHRFRFCFCRRHFQLDSGIMSGNRTCGFFHCRSLHFFCCRRNAEAQGCSFPSKT